MNAVEVNNLVKRYKSLTVLNDISFKIPVGQIVGILGPNGAGKTTLIKSLIGSIHPTNGSIKVLDLDPVKDKWKLREHLGYMPQDPSLYENLTTTENVSFFAKGSSSLITNKDVDEIIEFTELSSKANLPVYTFSGGMKKRVSLACSLVNKPEILFLDEPTAAVDPYLKIKSWKLFRELAVRGTTIIISTHLMDEAMLCDNLAILREGKLLAYDTPQSIIQNGSAEVDINNGESIRTEIINTPEAFAKELQGYGLNTDVQSVSISPQNLEDIIISLTSNTSKTNQ